MGLFNRQDDSPSHEEEELELPTREDFRQPLVGDEPPPAPSGSTRYGIDDAIALLRELPDRDDEQLVAIVCKTLESARIRPQDILRDAEHKEQRLEKERKGVEQQIADLEKQLKQKRQSLSDLEGSLEELRHTRARLQRTSGAKAQGSGQAQTRKPAAESEAQPATKPAAGARPEAASQAEPAGAPNQGAEAPDPAGAARRQRGPQR